MLFDGSIRAVTRDVDDCCVQIPSKPLPVAAVEPACGALRLGSASPVTAGIDAPPGADAATASLAFSLAIALTPLAVTTASPLPSGVAGTAYSQTLAASGGTTPYTWNLASGSLPEEVTFNSAGVISGTPATNGAYGFTVQLVDAYGLTASATLVLTIEAAAPAITTASPLPAGREGTYYSQALTGAGGTAPYAWSLIGGSLPAGLALDSLGDITGTPTAPGTFDFTVELTDSVEATNAKELAITIAGPALAITTASLPDGTVGAAYAQTLAATGGTPPYSWSLIWESLPGGLRLGPAGAISGTPTNAGTFSFTAQVADSATNTASQLFTVQIAHSAPGLSVQSYAGGAITLSVVGEAGADYEIDQATNLVNAAWQSVFTTNTAATPFTWSDTTTNNATFYRVLLVQ